MRKAAYLTVALIVLASLATAAPSEIGSNPGLTPDNPFYITEQIVETLEIGLAGVIGGEELKAKAMANNANERLAEAQKMKEKNKTEQAEKLAGKYEKTMNRSKAIAKNSKSSEVETQIEEVSNKNTEVLKEVKERTPSEAQKGLDKAIDASNKTKGVAKSNGSGLGNENVSEKVKNRTKDVREKLNKSGDKLQKGTNSDKLKNATSGLENGTGTLDDSTDNLENQTEDTLDTDDSNSITGDASQGKSGSTDGDQDTTGNPVDDLKEGIGLN